MIAGAEGTFGGRPGVRQLHLLCSVLEKRSSGWSRNEEQWRVSFPSDSQLEAGMKGKARRGRGREGWLGEGKEGGGGGGGGKMFWQDGENSSVMVES